MFTEKEITSFNSLEFEVYKYVINNNGKVPYMTIRELAQEAHVSTTTIVHFCKKVNCKGFSEFKVRLKIYNENPKMDKLDSDSMAIYDFFQRASTVEFINEMDVVSHVLEKAKTLLFVGVGTSGVMANYAARYFSSVGKFALHVDNPMYMISLENPKDSVVIIFSVSGEGITLVQNISLMKSTQATVVSVTNSKNNTIAKLSDYNISYYVQHELNKTQNQLSKVDITTQVPVTYIIESLARRTYNIRNDS